MQRHKNQYSKWLHINGDAHRKLQIKVQCADGTENIIVMKNVKVVPGLVKNLFSLSTVLRNNWDLLTETKTDSKVLKIKEMTWNTNSIKRYQKTQMEDI